MHDGIDRFKEKRDTLGVYFRIRSRKHEVRRHYRIYDTNSFFADFGGFLGLLLGHSVFGIYWATKNYMFSCFDKKIGGKKRNATHARPVFAERMETKRGNAEMSPVV